MAQIYYHDITSAVPLYYRDQIPGLGLYGCRALAVSAPEDWIILPRGADRHLDAALAHYEAVGLRHGMGFVFGDERDLKRHPHFSPNVYGMSEAVHRVLPDILWLPTARHLGDKNYFMSHCDNLGLARPMTEVVQFRGMQSSVRSFPVLVKLAASIHGQGSWHCADHHAYERVRSRIQVPHQVQEVLPSGTRFCVVEYSTEVGGTLEFVATVEKLRQKGGQTSYQPVRLGHLLRPVTDQLATWAQEQGMKGVWSYEVALTSDGRVLPLKCYPHWSDASYPLRVARKLGCPEWETYTLTGLSQSSATEFGLGELAYRSRLKEGVVVYNWATLAAGRLDMLVMGNPGVRSEYLSELAERFRLRDRLATA